MKMQRMRKVFGSPFEGPSVTISLQVGHASAQPGMSKRKKKMPFII